MQYDRAEEVLHSPEKFEVLYQGSSVWIDSLNPNKQTAEVIVNNQKQEVPVNNLIEVGKTL